MILGIWNNDIWTWLWLGWLLYFLIVEGLAVFGLKAPHGSLSDHIWKLLGYENPVGPHPQLRRMLMVGGWAVLTIHLFFWGYIPG